MMFEREQRSKKKKKNISGQFSLRVKISIRVEAPESVRTAERGKGFRGGRRCGLEEE